MKLWHVYMLRCNDNSLYVGIALDVEKRVKKHNEGKGAKYTRYKRPVRLVYVEGGRVLGEALRRENELKRLPKVEKERIASSGLDPS